MIRRTLLAGVALLAVNASASAFYFPGWPGATRNPVPALIVRHTPGDPPSVRLPIYGTTEPDPPGPPSGVPEPATIVLAGIGIAVIVRRSRKVS